LEVLWTLYRLIPILKLNKTRLLLILAQKVVAFIPEQAFLLKLPKSLLTMTSQFADTNSLTRLAQASHRMRLSIYEHFNDYPESKKYTPAYYKACNVLKGPIPLGIRKIKSQPVRQ
jgi:hypothetical protein